MEVKDKVKTPFIVERTDDVSVLSDFYCGVEQMDKFIHKSDGLKLYAEVHLTSLWIVRKGDKIIGFFALSKHSLRLNSDDVRTVGNTASSSLKEILDTIETFPALRIDYLAIHKDYRNKGLGSNLLALVREKIIQDNFSATLFITVDAYDTPQYSSVEFYKKNFFNESEYGKIRNMNKRIYGEKVDTKLMYLPLFK